MSDGALYTHLEKLIGAGYVQKRKEIAGTSSPHPLLGHRGEGKTLFREYLRFLEEIITAKNSGLSMEAGKLQEGE
ncbi:hypothetical protein [Marispirochaeta sp.]|uniref:hypothetical protein n=1 Tax=Marispirochaeta sp. TaxID=2038653 RepID=UPI0029C6159C|nr:hypothetical protein [Marispirochaeta sp.]